MKIRIECAEDIPEEEIVIRCREENELIQAMYHDILALSSHTTQLTYYQGNQEYHLPLESVLFFETDTDTVYAHTADDAYRVKFRLYELEDLLPNAFIRVSKSAILNTGHIYAIDRSLTSASLIHFHKSHKQVFVSRFYYKSLRQRLDERSYHER